MTKERAKARTVETRGGYPAGPKLVSELAPPPKGPVPGAKPSASDQGSKKDAGRG